MLNRNAEKINCKGKRLQQQEILAVPIFLTQHREETEEIGWPIHYFEFFSRYILSHNLSIQFILGAKEQDSQFKQRWDTNIYWQLDINICLYMVYQRTKCVGLALLELVKWMTRFHEIGGTRWKLIFTSMSRCLIDPNRDKLVKMRPLIDMVLPNHQNQEKGQMLCVDEQSVPFRGKSPLKQYNLKKPKKGRYKIFVLSDEKGIVHNFEVYTGKLKQPLENQLLERVVILF